MSADDEIAKTRSAIDEAAALIAQIRKDRAARPGPFEPIDEPDGGGSRHRVRQKAVRTVRNRGQAPPRSSGISRPGIG